MHIFNREINDNESMQRIHYAELDPYYDKIYLNFSFIKKYQFLIFYFLYLPALIYKLAFIV